jgi:hypothetical protein
MFDSIAFDEPKFNDCWRKLGPAHVVKQTSRGWTGAVIWANKQL